MLSELLYFYFSNSGGVSTENSIFLHLWANAGQFTAIRKSVNAYVMFLCWLDQIYKAVGFWFGCQWWFFFLFFCTVSKITWHHLSLCIHGWRIVWEWLLACIKSPITKCSCPKSLWISSNGVAAGFYPTGSKVRIKAGRLKVAKFYICSSQKAGVPITVSCCRAAGLGFVLDSGEEIVVSLL